MQNSDSVPPVELPRPPAVPSPTEPAAEAVDAQLAMLKEIKADIYNLVSRLGQLPSKMDVLDGQNRQAMGAIEIGAGRIAQLQGEVKAGFTLLDSKINAVDEHLSGLIEEKAAKLSERVEYAIELIDKGNQIMTGMRHRLDSTTEMAEQNKAELAKIHRLSGGTYNFVKSQADAGDSRSNEERSEGRKPGE